MKTLKKLRALRSNKRLNDFIVRLKSWQEMFRGHSQVTVTRAAYSRAFADCRPTVRPYATLSLVHAVDPARGRLGTEAGCVTVPELGVS